VKEDLHLEGDGGSGLDNFDADAREESEHGDKKVKSGK
jgi:hypothetical protein